MTRGRLMLGALLALAMAASFAVGLPGNESLLPRVDNLGPRGLGVLFTWLSESSVKVIAHDAPLTELPPEARVVVLAAPTAREVEHDEVAALKRFVEAGGTLIYLVPRNAPQPALNRWLQVSLGPLAPLNASTDFVDVGGSSIKVVLAGGLLRGAKQLRLSAGRTLSVHSEGALAVTEHDALWWERVGRGEVWLAAGPDLAENARLELADNALYWAHVASRGPVVFDEFHHHRSTAAVPMNLLATSLQLAFLAALFLWAKLPRLGPPREALPSHHRSSLEYVSAMANLAQNAGLKTELLAQLKADFRRFLQDELGIPAAETWEEADAQLAQRRSIEPGELVQASRADDFLSLSRQLATLERKVRVG